jgi:hypothetical protein
LFTAGVSKSVNVPEPPGTAVDVSATLVKVHIWPARAGAATQAQNAITAIARSLDRIDFIANLLKSLS